MTAPVFVILACILCGLGALVGMGVQALRHGERLAWRWLLLPIGVLLTFAFVPAIIGLAEGVWGAADVQVWLAVAVGLAGAVCQALGWLAVLRPRLRPGQCPACEYDARGLPRCPECGRELTPGGA